eukprot:3389327-Prymnesium_polylepis.1
MYASASASISTRPRASWPVRNARRRRPPGCSASVPSGRSTCARAPGPRAHGCATPQHQLPRVHASRVHAPWSQTRSTRRPAASACRQTGGRGRRPIGANRARSGRARRGGCTHARPPSPQRRTRAAMARQRVACGAADRAVGYRPRTGVSGPTAAWAASAEARTDSPGRSRTASRGLPGSIAPLPAASGTARAARSRSGTGRLARRPQRRKVWWSHPRGRRRRPARRAAT